MPDCDEREFGRLAASVDSMQTRFEDLRSETRESFRRLETTITTQFSTLSTRMEQEKSEIEEQLKEQSRRIGVLERWRAWALGATAMIIATVTYLSKYLGLTK